MIHPDQLFDDIHSICRFGASGVLESDRPLAERFVRKTAQALAANATEFVDAVDLSSLRNDHVKFIPVSPVIIHRIIEQHVPMSWPVSATQALCRGLPPALTDPQGLPGLLYPRLLVEGVLPETATEICRSVSQYQTIRQQTQSEQQLSLTAEGATFVRQELRSFMQELTARNREQQFSAAMQHFQTAILPAAQQPSGETVLHDSDGRIIEDSRRRTVAA